MYRHNSGYILITLLIFMNIFSLIGIYMLNHAFNTVKNNEHLWQRTQASFYARDALTTIENQLRYQYEKCKVPYISAGDIVKKPTSWWQSRCNGNLAGIQYFYCFELLAKEACVKEKSNSNSLFDADFYRITLLALPNLKGSKLFVQDIFVNAQPLQATCKESSRVLQIGRQIRRIL